MTSYKKLFLSIAVFTIGLSSTFSGFAFAENQNGSYHHTPLTALTDPNVVCGNHLCAPGESSVNPQPVVPVRGP
jgi:hypothetical protein